MSRKLLLIGTTAAGLLAAVSFLAVAILDEGNSEIQQSSAAAPEAPAPEPPPSHALIKRKFLATTGPKIVISPKPDDWDSTPKSIARPEPHPTPELADNPGLPDNLEPFFSVAWIKKASPALAAKLSHWRFEIDSKSKSNPGPPGDPAKGIFPWAATLENGTARLVNSGEPARPIKLTPVANEKDYVVEKNPNACCESLITPEFSSLLHGPEIAEILTKQYLRYPDLNVEKDAQSISVQEFDAALRVPGKKEHIWSISFYIRTDKAPRGGFDVWGLFTRVNGLLKPFYLVAASAPGEGALGNFPFFKAIGDLNGDGIDEMIVKELEYEPEDDHLKIFSWENGAPVLILEQRFS